MKSLPCPEEPFQDRAAGWPVPLGAVQSYSLTLTSEEWSLDSGAVPTGAAGESHAPDTAEMWLVTPLP